MDERIFLQHIQSASKAVGINSLLLLSGIEGLYTFKDVALNRINYSLLDSLILTIFALRIGDHFHTLAEANLASSNEAARHAAHRELQALSHDEIGQSSNSYLQSFAQLLNGKSIIRRYHEKALEAAATEIEKTQEHFRQNSIGSIVLYICHTQLQGTVDLSAIFQPNV